MTEMLYSYHFLVLQTSIIALISTSMLLATIILGLNWYAVFTIQQLIPVILSAVLTFLGSVTVLRGFEVGNVSVGGVILSSRVFISIPAAILIFGEIYPTIVYIIIILIIIGNICVSWTKGQAFNAIVLFKGSGGRWFILTAIFFAIGNIFVRSINNNLPLLVLLTLRFDIYFILAIILFPIFNPLLAHNKKPIISKDAILKTIVFAVLTIVGELAFISVVRENLTIAEGLGVFEGIFTFSISLLVASNIHYNQVLKEPLDRQSLSIRITGAGLAILGTICIFIMSSK